MDCHSADLAFHSIWSFYLISVENFETKKAQNGCLRGLIEGNLVWKALTFKRLALGHVCLWISMFTLITLDIKQLPTLFCTFHAVNTPPSKRVFQRIVYKFKVSNPWENSLTVVFFNVLLKISTIYSFTNSEIAT